MAMSPRWANYWKILRGRLIFAACIFVVCFIVSRWILPIVYHPPAVMTLREGGEHQIMRLRKNFDTGPAHGLKIKVNGEINGTAMIRVFEDGGDGVHREKMIGSGKVDGLLYEGDWYSDDCRLEYEPLSATSGNLKIEYSFKTSKPRAV